MGFVFKRRHRCGVKTSAYICLLTLYAFAVKSRRQHHLSNEIFDDQSRLIYLTMCTADRNPGMASITNASIVRDGIIELHQTNPVFGFCIMPDHLHLVISTNGLRPNKIGSRFKTGISKRFRRSEPEMKIWQRGCWDRVIRRNEGLLKVLSYTFMNPVRAGLTKDWWTYPWLGSPQLGPITETFFNNAPPENQLWQNLL